MVEDLVPFADGDLINHGDKVILQWSTKVMGPPNDLIERILIYPIANVHYACMTLNSYYRPLKHQTELAFATTILLLYQFV
jgi:hypothetical protein